MGITFVMFCCYKRVITLSKDQNLPVAWCISKEHPIDPARKTLMHCSVWIYLKVLCSLPQKVTVLKIFAKPARHRLCLSWVTDEEEDEQHTEAWGSAFPGMVESTSLSLAGKPVPNSAEPAGATPFHKTPWWGVSGTHRGFESHLLGVLQP